MKSREIRSKIAGVKKTQKITSAMEMVAASKMRKAQDQMQKAIPYADKIRTVISHLADSHPEYHHPFLQEREVSRVGYLVVSSDRGLCGGLNLNLFKTVLQKLAQDQKKNYEIELCTVGIKATSFFKRLGSNIIASAHHIGDQPQVAHIIGIVKVMLDAYAEGKLDAIYLCFNNFVNTMVQKPIIRPLLPMPKAEDEELNHYWDYLYEPDDAHRLIDTIMRRYIESQVYRAVVENIACFQAAQMVAMKNATENAGTVIDELELAFHKARQSAITQELAEIVAGGAAV